MAPTVHADRTFLYLMADWAPSRVATRARFDAIVKVAPGATVAARTPVTVRLFDGEGRLLGTHALEPAPGGDLVGPAWRHLHGTLATVADAVAQADAVLDGTCAARRQRAEAAHDVVLDAVPGNLGLAQEPHLRWAFRNHGATPLDVAAIFASTVIGLDGRALRPPPAAYNGFAQLPPGRTLSGFWCLDDLDPAAKRGLHRFQLEILGRRSDALDYRWDDAGQ